MTNTASRTTDLRPSILVVDDDASIRDTMPRLLRKQPVSVTCVDGGESALKVLEGGLRPRLILLDIDMPGMNGWQVLERLKEDETLASIPVVVISGVHQSGNVHGVESFMPKPFSLNELIALVRKHAGIL